MAEKKTKKKEAKKEKKGSWIKSAVSDPGAFTAKAKKRGITTAQLQENVLSDPDKIDK